MTALKQVTYRCLNESCGHEFRHMQGAHRPGQEGGPPNGCPQCGGLYLKWLDWFVVHTQAKAEPAVADKLQKLGYATLFLHYIKTIRHARCEKQVKRAYFPRYLFVGIEPGQGFYNVNTCEGVSTILTSDGRPLRVEEPVIENLRSHGDESGLIETVQASDRHRTRLKPGEMVRIVQGPMTGLWGQVEVDKGTEILVLIEMFKQQVRACLFPEALSPELQRTR